MINPLTQVYTTNEASALWGITTQKISKAKKILCPTTEYRRSSSTDLFSRIGLIRYFGEPLISFDDPTDETGESLSQVVSLSEAALLVNKSKDSLLFACIGSPTKKVPKPPRFTSDECRKSGNKWLITKAALNRVFLKQYDFKEERNRLGEYTSADAINQIYTPLEVAEIWGISKSTVLNLCNNILKEPHNISKKECRRMKNNNIFLITRNILLQHLGPPLQPFMTPTDRSGSAFNEIFTIDEIVDILNIDATTIRVACAGRKNKTAPTLTERECKKSGKTWLLTRSALSQLSVKTIQRPHSIYTKQPYDFKEELSRIGSYKNDPLSQVYTPAEAAKLWSVPQQKIINSCNRNLTLREEVFFIEETEYKKSEGTLLIHRIGLLRVFGSPKQPFNTPTDTTGKSLHEVIGTLEAAKILDKRVSTIVEACKKTQKGREPLLTNQECKKSGNTWLITCAGLERIKPLIRNRIKKT